MLGIIQAPTLLVIHCNPDTTRYGPRDHYYRYMYIPANKEGTCSRQGRDGDKIR